MNSLGSQIVGIRWVSAYDDFLALDGQLESALRVSAVVALWQEVCVPGALVLDRVDEFQRC